MAMFRVSTILAYSVQMGLSVSFRA